MFGGVKLAIWGWDPLIITIINAENVEINKIIDTNFIKLSKKPKPPNSKINTQTKNCESGKTIFRWNGTSNSGEKLKTGFYAFTIRTDQRVVKGKISLTKWSKD